MEPLTFDEEQNHQFDRTRALKLTDELISFLLILQEFCDLNKSQQPLDAVSDVLAHARKLANRIHFEISLIQ